MKQQTRIYLFDADDMGLFSFTSTQSALEKAVEGD